MDWEEVPRRVHTADYQNGGMFVRYCKNNNTRQFHFGAAVFKALGSPESVDLFVDRERRLLGVKRGEAFRLCRKGNGRNINSVWAARSLNLTERVWGKAVVDPDFGGVIVDFSESEEVRVGG